jgi:uncharacterized cupin superfamily protein
MKIDVHKPAEDMLKSENVRQWPIWEKEVSEFDWFYDTGEECFLLEGKVTVTAEDGSSVEFGSGDFVKFPKGLSCRWKVTEPVRKHYRFR